MSMLKTLYIDLDNVLVDFRSAFPHSLEKYAGHLDDIPGIFSLMRPIANAVESFQELVKLWRTHPLWLAAVPGLAGRHRVSQACGLTHHFSGPPSAAATGNRDEFKNETI